MKNIYILFLLQSIADKNTTFTHQSVQLCVLNHYSCKFGTHTFNDNDVYGNIRYWMQLMRGIVDKKLLKFFEEYAFVIIRDEQQGNESKKTAANSQIKEDLATSADNQIKVDLEKLMLTINYDGIENLTSLIEELNKDDNQLFTYEILLLRITTEQEKEEMERYISLLESKINVNKDKINSEELVVKYGLFPNISPESKQKQVMTKCTHCSKSEITDILRSMKVNNFKIIHLKSTDRYVYIRLLKISPFSPLSLDILKFFYLKHGLSLLKQDKKAQSRYFLELIHDFFCK